MAIDNPANKNITIRRNRDYVKIWNITGDYSTFTGRAQVRTTDKSTSTLVATFTVSVGAYNSGTGKTPITMSLTDAVTAAITKDNGHWDLVLTSAGIDETYIYGTASIKDTPTTLT